MTSRIICCLFATTFANVATPFFFDSVILCGLCRLSANGERSLIIDMADEQIAPEGWATLANEKPELECFNDIAIYELHIRDFRCR